MKSVEEIVALYKERLDAQGPILNQMREVRQLANGDVIVPLNELDRNTRSSVANLLVQGLDQMSMRVSSTMPSPYFPALREGQDRSMKLARDRKRAMLAIWDENRMNMKMRRRARHLLAYSNSPVFIKPNFDKRIPEWQLRNPLDTFPAPSVDVDNPVPDNCIFTYGRTYRWLTQNYGDAINGVLRVGNPSWDTMFKILFAFFTFYTVIENSPDIKSCQVIDGSRTIINVFTSHKLAKDGGLNQALKTHF